MAKCRRNGQHLNGRPRLCSSSNLSFFFVFSILTSIRSNADKVQIDLTRLPSFEKILAALEGQLLDGRIFQVRRFSLCSAFDLFSRETL